MRLRKTAGILACLCLLGLSHPAIAGKEKVCGPHFLQKARPDSNRVIRISFVKFRVGGNIKMVFLLQYPKIAKPFATIIDIDLVKLSVGD